MVVEPNRVPARGSSKLPIDRRFTSTPGVARKMVSKKVITNKCPKALQTAWHHEIAILCTVWKEEVRNPCDPINDVGFTPFIINKNPPCRRRKECFEV